MNLTETLKETCINNINLSSQETFIIGVIAAFICMFFWYLIKFITSIRNE